jgi:hypothetical protein
MSREDPDVADEMQRILSDEGIQFLVERFQIVDMLWKDV